MKTRETAQSGERTFSKSGLRVRERCPRPTIVAVLSIQKFSNFALFVIKTDFAQSSSNMCKNYLLKIYS